MSPTKKRGLGRGLDALLTPQVRPSEQENSSKKSDKNDDTILKDGDLSKIAINKLSPGKYQPRKDMSDSALEELSLSIKSQGIIQPIVVRLINTDNNGDRFYEIIAGERRWRAAKLAKLTEVPCLIKDVPDESAVAIALIENIQREDLNAMEEAVALDRLLTEFDLTHQEVALAVGKSRTAVTNLLRLNNLNDAVKTFLENGDIEMGHARALLALDDTLQAEAARTVATKELTVRETEALIKRIQNPSEEKPAKEKDQNSTNIEQNLAEKIGLNVAVSHNKKGKGKLVISYANLAELNDFISKIK
ncbi:ParB/RepB/Spo0J family partition protein [Colwellia sp. 1_MG-2023]|uniref:ParB/RepB/Spo0J family partition protein n=1 Tax=unclassified Colwellia TaxID=196834 RepID=UPI001C07FB2C|nr:MULTISPECIES: ParB/RepB/Spo0J family partition protein [unclassified Colwellia]MBU2923529.1 ParB/RepB/Spo0J family partition protein [Colwellia sp. C2M11]MDO6653296.1 ParB/RepB/Spo0J family partition protein [Colwellia sp. 3_MG-2023]MDO6664459.1 ParB/RepB/Spo0J family partition protein [Colwellia sp. 2_MG-2023]MDO6688810.1 ParB/RepB/Spo0J family partition protein [Colwellia sp. 1_MG-2023]